MSLKEKLQFLVQTLAIELFKYCEQSLLKFDISTLRAY